MTLVHSSARRASRADLFHVKRVRGRMTRKENVLNRTERIARDLYDRRLGNACAQQHRRSDAGRQAHSARHARLATQDAHQRPSPIQLRDAEPPAVPAAFCSLSLIKNLKAVKELARRIGPTNPGPPAPFEAAINASKRRPAWPRAQAGFGVRPA